MLPQPNSHGQRRAGRLATPLRLGYFSVVLEPSPFPKSMLRVVESRPARRTASRSLRGIAIDATGRGGPARPDLDGVNALLATIPRPDRIAVLQVSDQSKLTHLPSLSRFSNLEFVHIEARELRAYDPLHSLKKLKELCLVAYKGAELRPFRERRLRYLRLVRGNIRELSAHAELTLLQSCSKLERFTGSAIKHLTLDGCHRVQRESLGRIKGLTTLELLGTRSFPSFDFVRSCRALEELTVTASPLSNADTTALVATRGLKRVFLTVRDSVIADIGQRNPGLVITNGDVCFANGTETDSWSAWPE